MRILSFLLLLATITAPALGQSDVFLRLEKINGTKVKRFDIGRKLYYKGVDQDWTKGQLERIDVVDQMLYFDAGPIRVEDLTGIQTVGQHRLAQLVKWNLIILGGSALVFGGYEYLVSGVYPLFGVYIAAVAVPSGFLLGKLLELRYYRVGSKWRARIIDTAFR